MALDVSALYRLRGRRFDDGGTYQGYQPASYDPNGGGSIDSPEASAPRFAYGSAPRASLGGHTLDLQLEVDGLGQYTGRYFHRLEPAEYLNALPEAPGQSVYSSGMLYFDPVPVGHAGGRPGPRASAPSPGGFTLSDVRFNREERTEGGFLENRLMPALTNAFMGWALGAGVGGLAGSAASAAGAGSGTAAGGAAGLLGGAATNAATSAVMQLIHSGRVDLSSLAQGVVTGAVGRQINGALAAAGVPAAMAPQVTQALIGVARGQDPATALANAAINTGLNYATTGGNANTSRNMATNPRLNVRPRSDWSDGVTDLGGGWTGGLDAWGGDTASTYDFSGWNSDLGLDGTGGDALAGWNSDLGLDGAAGDVAGGTVSSPFSFNLGSGGSAGGPRVSLGGLLGGAGSVLQGLGGVQGLTQIGGGAAAAAAALRAMNMDAPRADLAGAQDRGNALAAGAVDTTRDLYGRGMGLFDQSMPLYQQIIDANRAAAGDATARAGQLYQQGQDAYNASAPVYQQGIDQARTAAGLAAGQSNALARQYNEAFAPVVNRVAADAMNYDAPGEIERRSAAAGAAAQAQIDAQQGAAERALARTGAAASSGRALMAPEQANQAAAVKAGAINAERAATVNQGIQMRQQAAGLGLNVGAQGMQQGALGLSAGQSAGSLAGQRAGQLAAASQPGMQMQSLGLQANQAAAGVAGQRAATLGQTAQPGLAAQGQAVGANSAAADIGLNRFRTDAQMYGARQQALGNVAGMGTRLALSDERAKTDRAPVDEDAAMEGLRRVPVESWQYKPGAGDGGAHVGPMAQDMQAAFGDQVAPGGQAIDLVSANGVQQAALKSVDRRLAKVEALLSGKGMARAPAKPRGGAFLEDADAPGVKDHGLVRI